MKSYVNAMFISIVVMFLNGCNLEGLDFDKLSKDTGISPEFVIPIAKANISVWDLVQSANKDNEDLIQKDPNGLIKIVYQQSDFINYKVSSIIPNPGTQNFSSGSLVIGDILPKDVNVETSITLNQLSVKLNGLLDGILPFNGMKIPFPPIVASGMDAHFNLDAIKDYSSITLRTGTVEITLKNEMQVPLTIDGSLFDVGNNRSVTDFTFTNIAPHLTKVVSADLTGIQLSNQVEFRLKNFNTPGSLTPVNINLEDYFKVSFQLKDLAISKGNLMISKSQFMKGHNGEFEFMFPEPDIKAFSAVLKKGSLSISVKNGSQLTGSINFKLNEITRDGVPLEATIPLRGNSTTIDLSGAAINFSANPLIPFNHIPYFYSLSIDQTPGFIDFSSSDEIQMDVVMDGFEFKSLTGDFGKRSITIDPGSFELNVDLLNRINGNFKLSNPTLALIVHNSIGIPGSVKLEFIAKSKDGLIAPLNPPLFDIPVPKNLNAGIATKNVVFDKGNSQIVNFIGLPPTGKILYSGQVDFNTGGIVTLQNPNFMDMDASIGFDWLMELPMELQVNQLGFKDTTSISGADFKNFASADLIVNAVNGIPLEFEMQLLFVDTISKTQYGVSEVSKILSAALVDASGDITPVQSSHTFSLNKTDIENLRKSNGLVFSGAVSSPSSGTAVAPIYSGSEIKLNVVIKSKVNL